MTGQLFTLRYKHGNAGVVTEWVEADSLEEAKQIGEVYVNQKFNARFISVTKAVVADASILKDLGIPPVEPPAAPDDETSLPVSSKRAAKVAEPPAVPIDPVKERRIDAEQEAEDRKEDLLRQEAEAKAAAEAKNRKPEPVGRK